MQIPVHEANLELGVIGNGSFGALVDARGRVVWSCLPAFDGDPAFCALLSPRDHDGGDFGIELEDFAHAEQAYVLKLVLSMIPIGVIGFLFKDRINAMLDAPYILVIVGAMLLLTATLLAFAYYAKPRQKETISYRDALIIGLAQACAAMPGLSRSGTTIATGLLLGNKKAAVAQFSFLMVLAPILGETLLEAASGDLTAGIATGTLAAGFAASFITGCLACKFMIEIVKRGKLIWFSLYCALAGLVSILSYFC